MDGSESLVSLIQRAQQDASNRSKSRRTLKKSRDGSDQTQYTAASFYVPRLPAQPQDVQLPIMYSGHLPASYSLRDGPKAAKDAQSDAHLFWLLVKAKHIADRQKLVIWFNGGPGCSSFDGAMLEIGPILVHGKGRNTTLIENPGRWNEYANILFIDQPAGTGYSYINTGKAVTELAPAADQIVHFLDNFYSIFPEYSKLDTYIAGESYAGTTIPYLARAIQNSATLSTPLKGLLIGNGWFSPKVQYPAYVQYGEERGFFKKENTAVKKARTLLEQCNATLSTKQGDHVLVGLCEGLIGAVMDVAKSATSDKDGCLAAYDVRRRFENCGEYPAGINAAKPYLQRETVKAAYHAEHKFGKWEQCNNTVGNQMWSPKSRPSVELLPDLLETIPMLFFAGDADLMCNWLGIEKTLEQMSWKGQTGFGNATDDEWYVNGTLAGTWRTARNMTWVKVFEAGHMVPIDKPNEAHDILLRFIGVETLAAAGDPSRIPSRIGSSKHEEAVIGKVAPDGGTLPAVISQQEKAAAAASASAAAAVDYADSVGQPIDKERELLYGPRRSAVLLLIILSISVGLYGLLRWRASKRRSKGWSSTTNGKHNLLPSHGSRNSLNSKWRRPSGEASPISMASRDRRARADSDLRPSSEDNFLQRIDEHEEREGYTDDDLEEVAKQAFAIDDDEPANPWHGVTSPRRK